jgi:transcriptional regulator with XRE-family HTH domain
MDYITARQLLGDRIRNLRKKKSITQERLAELIDKTTEHRLILMTSIIDTIE